MYRIKSKLIYVLGLGPTQFKTSDIKYKKLQILKSLQFFDKPTTIRDIVFDPKSVQCAIWYTVAKSISLFMRIIPTGIPV